MVFSVSSDDFLSEAEGSGDCVGCSLSQGQILQHHLQWFPDGNGYTGVVSLSFSVEMSVLNLERLCAVLLMHSSS